MMKAALLLLVVVAFLGSASAVAIPYVGNPYKDYIGRGYAMPLAAAAYSTAPDGCLQNMRYNGNNKYNMKFNSQRTAKCGENVLNLDEFCSGYTAVDLTSQIIIVSFEGSLDYLQIATEIWDVNNLVNFTSGGKVAGYFNNAFNAVWNAGMKDDFMSLKNRYPSYSVYFIGHSLGGAMASLAAATVVSKNIVKARNVALITMGQPRTGDIDYANGFDALKIEAYRIIHQDDPVPHLPPENMWGYHHHLSEVWYNNDMPPKASFVVCDKIQEDNTTCSDSLSNWDYLTITQHTHYFGEDVSEYGENSCQHVSYVDGVKSSSYHPKSLAQRKNLKVKPVIKKIQELPVKIKSS